MRVIISESKLGQAVFKFLDTQLGDAKKRTFYIGLNRSTKYTMYVVKGDKIFAIRIEPTPHIIIYKKPIEILNTFFGLDIQTAMSLIKEWVLDRYDIGIDSDKVSISQVLE